MLGIMLSHGAIFGVLGFLISLTRFVTKNRYGDDSDGLPDFGGALIGGVISCGLVISMTWIVLMVGEPSMDHRLEAGGWGLTFYNLVAVIVALVATDAIRIKSRFAFPFVPTAVALIGTVLVVFIGYPIDANIVNPPDRILCDSTGHAQMVTSILPVNPATQGTSNDPSKPDYKYADLTQPDTKNVPPTNPNVLIQVTPELATAEANQNLNKLNQPNRVPVTSYAELNNVYLQKYQNHWYYVADLKVNNFQAFKQAGRTIPGYLLISAEDPTAPVVAMTGFTLSYVPGVGVFSYDLDRTVYYNWTLNHTQYEVLDLSGGLEIDESGRPWYLGTLVSPVDGLGAAKKVVGMIEVDPATAQVTQWSLGQIPPWVDRVYPEDWVNTYLTNYWAPYFDRDACNLGNTAGQAEIESDTYQITGSPGDPTGAAFVFTYTSHSNPQSLLGEVVVDPKTGYTKAYSLSGKGASYADANELVDRALSNQRIGNVSPEHCQLHQIYGQTVWYCILLSGGKFYYGVALLQTRNSTDANQVIIDNVSLPNALSRLQDQIVTNDLQNNAALRQSELTDAPFQGVVTHMTNSSFQRNGHAYIGFTISGTSGTTGQPIPPGVTFVADVTADTSSGTFHDLPWVQVGNHVFVTADVIPGSSEYTLTSVTDPDVFPPTPRPSIPPATPTPTASPKR